MAQSHVFLTQTFVQTEKMQKLLAYAFISSKSFNQMIGKIEKLANVPQEDLDNNWNVLLGTRRVLVKNYNEKKDFSKDIMSLYEVYSQPTLLFLGDLNSYSTQLQEGMLRILEEPPHNLFIILFAQNRSQVIPTISSRCQFHLLNYSLIMKYLDQKLLEKTKKNLPDVSDFAKKLVSKKPTPIPDLKKVEREEIDFWLWQLNLYLQEYYKKSLSKKIAIDIEKVLTARHMNNQNLQKKFAFGWLV